MVQRSGVQIPRDGHPQKILSHVKLCSSSMLQITHFQPIFPSRRISLNLSTTIENETKGIQTQLKNSKSYVMHRLEHPESAKDCGKQMGALS